MVNFCIFHNFENEAIEVGGLRYSHCPTQSHYVSYSVGSEVTKAGEICLNCEKIN